MVDATWFARFSNINGNDSVNFFDFGDGEFAQGWQLNAMGHDLQRSVLDAPVETRRRTGGIAELRHYAARTTTDYHFSVRA
jgi:hypothetical protein